MLTAAQRKELEALEAEMREANFYDEGHGQKANQAAIDWADRIAAVLANGEQE